MNQEMPNKITAANAGIALWSHAGRQWPGVAEFWRWAMHIITP
jgi:hypothetical protein